MNERSFTDHYEILQISSNADLHVIERVYRLLAKVYHPDNPSTGNAEKFERLSASYKVLSHPEKRAAYDTVYEQTRKDHWNALSNAYASDTFEPDRHLRRMILSVLYARRRQDPDNAGVGIVQLENVLQWPGETLNFHVWYLKEKNLIRRNENGGFEITVHGIDQIEENGLFVTKDRLLPESTLPAGHEEGSRLIELVTKKAGHGAER